MGRVVVVSEQSLLSVPKASLLAVVCVCVCFFSLFALVTVGAFLLTIGASLLAVGALLLTVGKCD